ncbi:MAG: thiamine pyrophosphate-dependent enzyme [Solirubrobacteraceae bacterium]
MRSRRSPPRASLGAALAGSGPAVCVCGDGGFLFACGELATVAQCEVPLTVVLVDDGGHRGGPV